jgi:hypothetical protein
MEIRQPSLGAVNRCREGWSSTSPIEKYSSFERGRKKEALKTLFDNLAMKPLTAPGPIAASEARSGEQPVTMLQPNTFDIYLMSPSSIP